MVMSSKEGAAVKVDFGEGNNELLPQSCGMAAKQAKEESMKGRWAGIELYVKMGSIAVVVWMCSEMLIPR